MKVQVQLVITGTEKEIKAAQKKLGATKSEEDDEETEDEDADDGDDEETEDEDGDDSDSDDDGDISDSDEDEDEDEDEEEEEQPKKRGRPAGSKNKGSSGESKGPITLEQVLTAFQKLAKKPDGLKKARAILKNYKVKEARSLPSKSFHLVMKEIAAASK